MQTGIFIIGVSASMVTGLVFGQSLGQTAVPGGETEAFFKYVFGGGAVTVLGALAFYLAVYVLPKTYEKHKENIDAIQKQHTEAIKALGDKHAETIESIVSRFDGWEKTRHEDANKLNETLRNVVSHCAKQGAT